MTNEAIVKSITHNVKTILENTVNAKKAAENQLESNQRLVSPIVTKIGETYLPVFSDACRQVGVRSSVRNQKTDDSGDISALYLVDIHNCSIMIYNGSTVDDAKVIVSSRNSDKNEIVVTRLADPQTNEAVVINACLKILYEALETQLNKYPYDLMTADEITARR